MVERFDGGSRMSQRRLGSGQLTSRLQNVAQIYERQSHLPKRGLAAEVASNCIPRQLDEPMARIDGCHEILAPLREPSETVHDLSARGSIAALASTA